MSIIILRVALLISFYSRPILKLFYGENFMEGAPALAFLAWSMFFQFIGSVNFSTIGAESRQKVFLVLSVYMVLVAIVLNSLLIPRYSLTGAAVAAVMRQIVFYTTMLFIPSMRKYTVATVIASLRPLLAVGCAAASLYWVGPPIGVLLAIPVYLLVLWLLRAIDREDRGLLLRSIRRT